MSRPFLLVLILLATSGYWLADHWGDAKLALGVEESADARAIELAKAGFALNRLTNDEDVIRDRLDGVDDIQVIGWRASRQTEEVYWVKYLYMREDAQVAYHFEVNLKTGRVRDIEAAPDLAAQYGIEPAR